MYDDTKLPINCLLYIPEETKENHSQVIKNTDPLKTAGLFPHSSWSPLTAQREKRHRGSHFFLFYYTSTKKNLFLYMNKNKCTYAICTERKHYSSFCTFILPSSPLSFECYTHISWFLRCMKIATLAQGNPRCLYKL